MDETKPFIRGTAVGVLIWGIITLFDAIIVFHIVYAIVKHDSNKKTKNNA